MKFLLIFSWLTLLNQSDEYKADRLQRLASLYTYEAFKTNNVMLIDSANKYNDSGKIYYANSVINILKSL